MDIPFLGAIPVVMSAMMCSELEMEIRLIFVNHFF